jgi:hypothetical protein
MNHFGHFMAECVHRIAIGQALDADRPWLFVSGRDRAAAESPPPFARETLELLGVALDTAWFVTRPTQVEDLLVAEQGSDLMGGPKPGYLSLLGNAVHHRLDERFGNQSRSAKVYVSRTGLGVLSGRLLAETYLEQQLASEGFEIFHPERHSIAEQLDCYRKAQVLVFSEGSAVHGVELLGQSLGQVVLLNRRQPMHSACIAPVRARARQLLTITSNLPIGTPLQTDDGRERRSRGLAVLDSVSVLRVLRAEGIARLESFSPVQYLEHSEAELADYVSELSAHHPLVDPQPLLERYQQARAQLMRKRMA